MKSKRSNFNNRLIVESTENKVSFDSPYPSQLEKEQNAAVSIPRSLSIDSMLAK